MLLNLTGGPTACGHGSSTGWRDSNGSKVAKMKPPARCRNRARCSRSDGRGCPTPVPRLCGQKGPGMLHGDSGRPGRCLRGAFIPIHAACR